MVKWLPVIAAGLIFLSGCAPVVKENGKTMPRIDGEAKIEWNREKYPLAVEILNSHGEKERQVFYSPPKRVAGGLAELHRNTASSWGRGSYHCGNGRP